MEDSSKHGRRNINTCLGRKKERESSQAEAAWSTGVGSRWRRPESQWSRKNTSGEVPLRRAGSPQTGYMCKSYSTVSTGAEVTEAFEVREWAIQARRLLQGKSSESEWSKQ